MGSNHQKITLKPEKDENEFADLSLYGQRDSIHQESIDIPSSSDDENDQSDKNKQLVLFDPAANGNGAFESSVEPIQFQSTDYPSYSPPNRTSRVLPSIGAFTVQCANCFKWRLIPTKEKYEEIREHILELPFYCKTAQAWRPDISCDDPPDISQDGSRLWAIDKPNIAQPPPGWQRLLRIRGEGGSKFADVYYVAPSGKRLRSMVEIHRYLLEHPEYAKEVTTSQFSFQIPKPLQENYVRKRNARLNSSCDGSRPIEPKEVRPLAWSRPNDLTELQLHTPGLSPPCIEVPVSNPVHRRKRQARATPSKDTYNIKSNIGTESI